MNFVEFLDVRAKAVTMRKDILNQQVTILTAVNAELKNESLIIDLEEEDTNDHTITVKPTKNLAAKFYDKLFPKKGEKLLPTKKLDTDEDSEDESPHPKKD